MDQPGQFQQDAYNEKDVRAKELVSHFLHITGYEDIESEENFSHDMTAVRGGDKFYFELEVKHKRYSFTTRESYPFDTVHFLGRKRHLHYTQPFYYIIIDAKSNWACIAHSGTIYQDQRRKMVRVDTPDKQGYDEMYEVSTVACLFVNLNEAYSPEKERERIYRAQYLKRQQNEQRSLQGSQVWNNSGVRNLGGGLRIIQ